MSASSLHAWFMVLFMPLAYGVVIGVFIARVSIFVRRITGKGPKFLDFKKPQSARWAHLRAVMATKPLPKYMKLSIRNGLWFGASSLLVLVHAPYSWPFSTSDAWFINQAFQVVATALSPFGLVLCLRQLYLEVLDYVHYTELDLDDDVLGLMLANDQASDIQKKCPSAANEDSNRARRL